MTDLQEPVLHLRQNPIVMLLLLRALAESAGQPADHADEFPAAACRNSKKPFVFLVQVMFARNPMLGLVMAWASDKDPAKSDKPHEEQTPFERCLQE